MSNAYIVDPGKKSWIANSTGSDFPIQNIPLGIFSLNNTSKKICSRIGDSILDLHGLTKEGILKSPNLSAADFEDEFLNALIKKGKPILRELRKSIVELFDKSNHQVDQATCSKYIIPLSEVQMHLPVKAGDYTDFYSSKEHATNVGTMFRDPNNALLPNWLHIPVGYHGRASSIVVSGIPIKRPHGQIIPKDSETPIFGATKQLDFELEMAFVIGKGNPLGSPVAIHDAESHIQGLLLFNDWSARDIQKWEYVPLGPFLGKNFASSISAWLIDLDALQEFKTAGPKPEKEILNYLKIDGPQNYNIHLEVYIQTADGIENLICQSNMKYLYWNMSQQLAHHTVNGCNMEVGDICASGTISGPDENSFGSMLELAWKGMKPLKLKDGSERTFINDGDTVVMKAYAQNEFYRIGFGEVRGKVLPSN